MSNPIYLLADSQLLFWKRDNELFLRSILNFVDDRAPSAAYIGASNGDQQAFFEIFVAAMEGIGIDTCHMIHADYSSEDRQHLETASIILLAGGDVKKGWDTFVATGMKEAIQKRYGEGALLIGVSAGAVQLGTCVLNDEGGLSNTFQVLPFIVDVHAEQSDWANLKQAVSLNSGFEQGIGICAGAGVIYHPDHTLEPIRHNLVELTKKEGEVVSGIVCPHREQETLPLH